VRLLDLFCCQGGASEGYRRAGFEVVGVDNVPQPKFPFEFHQADALAFVAEHGHEFDVIHASPPCQAYSQTKKFPGAGGADVFPALVPETRAALEATGRPWVLENVVGAPMPHAVLLCGRAYGLASGRHRLFESSVFLMSSGCCCGADRGMPIAGHGVPSWYRRKHGRSPALPERKAAIGAPEWMDREGLRESIPPAFTQHVGEQVLEQIGEVDGVRTPEGAQPEKYFTHAQRTGSDNASF
jgi:DNA (cytosine-5)-methyltransferase 1